MRSLIHLNPKAASTDTGVYSSRRIPSEASGLSSSRIQPLAVRDAVLPRHVYACAGPADKVGSEMIYVHGHSRPEMVDDVWKASPRVDSLWYSHTPLFSLYSIVYARRCRYWAWSFDVTCFETNPGVHCTILSSAVKSDCRGDG